ncbi:MAG TPA: amidohydrolase family protein [Pyrinomonadaceae bacterium]|nr:amidohydrolase family protein [Pyrinomonadaceae bacterium]
MKILAAEYVLPISSEPIRNGAVAIDADKIVATGTRDDLRSGFPDAEVADFGMAAILPGFVNCHSHLEVTSMRGALDAVEHDFGSWLLKLNDIRSGLSQTDIDGAALLGAREGVRAGVTCFGDIGRYGDAGFKALKVTGLRGVLFQETEFSPDNATAADAFEKLKDKFLALREKRTELVEVGISPHAPYTVSRRLFELIAEYALAENIKLTIHAAESGDEDRLLRSGDGFFMGLYRKFGVSWEVPNCGPIEFLSRTGILAARPLLAHCVTVDDSDIETIAANGTTIAHCPKSNAKFGHGYAPYEKFVDAGIATGLGSDSVASNNVCDLLDESRFAALAARNHPDRRRFISARDVLTTATLGGAKALRLDDKIGTLETGKQADVAVVSLDQLSQVPVGDVEAALVFSSNARDVVMTMVAGKELFAGRDRFAT